MRFNVLDARWTLLLLTPWLSACHATLPSERAPLFAGASVYDLGSQGGTTLAFRLPSRANAGYSTQATVADVEHYVVTLVPTLGSTFSVRVQPVEGNANLTFTNVPAGTASMDIKAYDAANANITSSVAYSGVSVLPRTGPTSTELSIRAFPIPNAVVAVVQLVDTANGVGLLNTSVTAQSGDTVEGPLAIGINAGRGTVQATSSSPL